MIRKTKMKRILKRLKSQNFNILYIYPEKEKKLDIHDKVEKGNRRDLYN